MILTHRIQAWKDKKEEKISKLLSELKEVVAHIPDITVGSYVFFRWRKHNELFIFNNLFVFIYLEVQCKPTTMILRGLKEIMAVDYPEVNISWYDMKYGISDIEGKIFYDRYHIY